MTPLHWGEEGQKLWIGPSGGQRLLYVMNKLTDSDILKVV